MEIEVRPLLVVGETTSGKWGTVKIFAIPMPSRSETANPHILCWLEVTALGNTVVIDPKNWERPEITRAEFGLTWDLGDLTQLILVFVGFALQHFYAY